MKSWEHFDAFHTNYSHRFRGKLIRHIIAKPVAINICFKPSTTKAHANRRNIALASKERNWKMFNTWADGHSLRCVGKTYGLSPERVRQIALPILQFLSNNAATPELYYLFSKAMDRHHISVRKCCCPTN